MERTQVGTHTLSCVATGAIDLPPLSASRLHREASDRFMCEYDALELVNHYGEVDVEWHKLVSSQRPISALRLDHVPVLPFPGAGKQRIRPVKRSRVPLHPVPKLGHAEAVLDQSAAPPSPSHDDAESNAGDSDEELAEAGVGDELAELLEEVMDTDFGARVLGGDADEQGAQAVEEPQPAEASGEVEAIPGAEEDESNAPPPPPEPAACARGAAVAPRRGATVTVAMPGGTVSYYPSKAAFEAVCENAAHGRCVLTRSCRSRGVTAAGLPKGGRPVGFLAAWLGHAESTPTKAAHWGAACLRNSLEARQVVRGAIVDSGEAGKLLTRCERALADGEPPEPPSLEGYGV